MHHGVDLVFVYGVEKHKEFFLQLLKTLFNDIADPIVLKPNNF
jgi:hypothetical protein